MTPETGRVRAASHRAGVCAPRGFEAGVAAAGIRGDGDDARLDVAIIRSRRPCGAAGVFTRNAVKAAPVVISELTLRQGRVQAVVFTSGNANACTGAQGYRDALATCKAVADRVELDPPQVLVCSTGVIGRPMPMDRVVAGIADAASDLGPERGDLAARAIMTTDTVTKTAVRHVDIGGVEVVVGGMAKGSGMIHPDMATLLALVTTDAVVDPQVLAPLLRRVADETFNCVTIDGDTSTNDTLLLLANGAAENDTIVDGSPEAVTFEAAVQDVCDDLAEQVAADGEGAQHHVRVEVTGAADRTQARLCARTIAGSALVKTAIHGADPNWGRILAAAGRTGAALVLDRAVVRIGDIAVFANGQPVDVDLAAVRRAFSQRRVDIAMDLGAGDAVAHAWGCDLTAAYVHINADYTT